MSFKVIPKASMDEWIGSLCAGYRLIGPQRQGTEVVFEELSSGKQVDLTYATTILPPKRVLLPIRERLFSFHTNGKWQLEPLIENRPTILFAVHTCDLHAITMLDHVFGQGYADEHYLARRKNLTIVSLECLRPCSEYAFCKDMGTLVTPDEFDMHLTDLGDAYAVAIGSAKGAALLNYNVSATEAGREDVRRFNEVVSDKWPRFPMHLDTDVAEVSSLLRVCYRSRIWDEIGDQCLGCGVCTLVCPTCTCFDVVDEMDLGKQSGERCRVWDSCQFAQFATVAGGHDFRNGHGARLRHRFSHKFRYQFRATGMVGCVGCGRCAQNCLVEIDPIKVLNKLFHSRTASPSERREVS